MKKPVSSLVVWSLALGVAGCSAISDFDDYTFGGGEADIGPPDTGSVDSGDRPDAGPDAGPVDSGELDSGESDGGRDSGPRMPTGIVQTAGGAVIITSEYQLRISIGAPQPIGHRDDGTSSLTVGPGSL
jgi:hypothetical protein